MKTQYIYALVSVENGMELTKSYWVRKADIAKYLGVTPGCINIASKGVCKCKGYYIETIDLNELIESVKRD